MFKPSFRVFIFALGLSSAIVFSNSLGANTYDPHHLTIFKDVNLSYLIYDKKTLLQFDTRHLEKIKSIISEAKKQRLIVKINFNLLDSVKVNDPHSYKVYYIFWIIRDMEVSDFIDLSETAVE